MSEKVILTQESIALIEMGNGEINIEQVNGESYVFSNQDEIIIVPASVLPELDIPKTLLNGKTIFKKYSTPIQNNLEESFSKIGSSKSDWLRN